MEKKTLSNILEGKIFQIPDYQRGYAWEEKQWKDFVQDIDALIDDKIISHYTGTLKIIYQVRHKMIHKARRIEIDTKELSEAQMNMVNLFLRLIEINTKFGFKDKETLIQKLNEIKS